MLKKEYLCLILIFFLFIISSASAEEIDGDSFNGTDFLSVDVDEIEVQYQSSSIENESSLGNDSADEAIFISDVDLEEESLGDAPGISNNRTFTELLYKIYYAPKGGTIYLDKDYYFNDDFYNSGTTGNIGMSINYPITIEGNGHIIDALSKSHFNIYYNVESFTINNVTFKNFISHTEKVLSGYYTYASTFRVYGVRNFSFVNCNFINFKCNERYSFIVEDSGSVSFINCTFANCSSFNDGGALLLYNCNNSLIDNCRFINCSSLRWGGAVFLWKCVNASIIDSSFINNSATRSGGAVLVYNVSNSLIANCSFDGNHARGTVSDRIFDIPTDETGGYEQFNLGSWGGAIFLEDVDYSLIDSCSFDNNFASGGGGSVYALFTRDSEVKSSNFSNNSAFYAGTIFYEVSKGIFNNISVSDSSSFYFGGALASRNAEIIVNGSKFSNYQSLNGAGGAIYNYQGSAMVTNSSFLGGQISRYGGAIANSQANLTILSSNFINNSASNGGAVYSVHGDVYVNDSFFKNSFSNQGSALYCMLSNSLVVTNNIFINNTGDKYNVYSLYSNRNIVEEGNHFENLYHVMIEYCGILNGKLFTQKSKVLNYVISNDGTFLNDYGSIYSNGDGGQLVTLNLFNSDCPDNSTIYGDYDGLFKTTFYFQRNYDLASEFKNYELINVYLYDDAGLNNNPEKISDISDAFQISMDLAFANRTIFEYEDLIGFNGYNIAISLINSSQSDIANIPSYYDSREYGYVTPVRNQGDGGNCWAFAGLATLEACIKKATGLTYDFSENNPKNLMAMDSTMGANMTTNGGGFDSVVMGYLTSWLGPVSEKADMYDDYSSLSPVLPSIFHVQNIYFLPVRQNNLDNALFKRAIMDYGAVSVSLKWSNGVNHAVSLVGWIDKFDDYDSLGNFAKHAWIFKNSWGANWEDGGFGYLSFDVPFLSDDAYSPYNAYTFIFDEDKENYFKSYQYEYSGVYDYLASEGSIYYSTKFVCNENPEYDEGLSAFSTFFKDPTNFTVSVHVNGELVLTQDGYREAGYYTIPFNKVIDVNNGDEFTITVANHNPGMNYAPVCHADETTVANVRPNTSLVSFDGRNWHDLYDLKGPNEYFYQADDQSNTCQIACIKAFTSLYNAQILRLDVNEFNSVNINEKITIDLSVYGNQFYFDTMEVTNNTLISLNINGKYYYAKLNDGEASINVSFDNGGAHTLSAEYGNNLFSSNIVQFNFTVNKEGTVLMAKSMSKVYGGSENSIVTLKDSKGNLIRDALITFTLNGKQTVFKTNDKGQISVPISLAPSTYTATVSYDGNNTYSGTNIKVSITVKKATPKLIASKKTFKRINKTKKYSVALKDNLGRAIKNKKVKLTIKGKTYIAKTNANGKATFKIKNLNVDGLFKATVKFAGNKYYRGVSKKITLEIKK
jgi:C1A family cysteine protease